MFTLAGLKEITVKIMKATAARNRFKELVKRYNEESIERFGRLYEGLTK